jgi:hypothetical protein
VENGSGFSVFVKVYRHSVAHDRRYIREKCHASLILFQLVSSDEQAINLMDRVQWCGNNSPRAGISPRFPGCFNSIRAASPPLDMRVVFLLLPCLIRLIEACPTGCLLATHYVVNWTLTSTFSCF